jgi:hypothetical protein
MNKCTAHGEQCGSRVAAVVCRHQLHQRLQPEKTEACFREPRVLQYGACVKHGSATSTSTHRSLVNKLTAKIQKHTRCVLTGIWPSRSPVHNSLIWFGVVCGTKFVAVTAERKTKMK